ncbi:MAG: hypothetical protein PHO67_07050 [Candidatus Omnitrophica bacterium]|nr:hypothetical protein [Candidatus Omnitrophota bacterium]
MNLSEFLKTKGLKIERRMFVVSILSILIGYIGVTLWLNAIRATAPLWFVWVLIIIQFTLYFSIFNVSYQRSKVCGYKRFSLIIFLVLGVLGRVNDWELLIIPLLIITMFIVSARTKNISREWQNQFKI